MSMVSISSICYLDRVIAVVETIKNKPIRNQQLKLQIVTIGSNLQGFDTNDFPNNELDKLTIKSKIRGLFFMIVN